MEASSEIFDMERTDGLLSYPIVQALANAEQWEEEMVKPSIDGGQEKTAMYTSFVHAKRGITIKYYHSTSSVGLLGAMSEHALLDPSLEFLIKTPTLFELKGVFMNPHEYVGTSRGYFNLKRKFLLQESRICNCCGRVLQLNLKWFRCTLCTDCDLCRMCYIRLEAQRLVNTDFTINVCCHPHTFYTLQDLFAAPATTSAAEANGGGGGGGGEDESVGEAFEELVLSRQLETLQQLQASIKLRMREIEAGKERTRLRNGFGSRIRGLLARTTAVEEEKGHHLHPLAQAQEQGEEQGQGGKELQKEGQHSTKRAVLADHLPWTKMHEHHSGGKVVAVQEVDGTIFTVKEAAVVVQKEKDNEKKKEKEEEASLFSHQICFDTDFPAHAMQDVTCVALSSEGGYIAVRRDGTTLFHHPGDRIREYVQRQGNKNIAYVACGPDGRFFLQKRSGATAFYCGPPSEDADGRRGSGLQAYKKIQEEFRSFTSPVELLAFGPGSPCAYFVRFQNKTEKWSNLSSEVVDAVMQREKYVKSIWLGVDDRYFIVYNDGSVAKRIPSNYREEIQLLIDEEIRRHKSSSDRAPPPPPPPPAYAQRERGGPHKHEARNKGRLQCVLIQENLAGQNNYFVQFSA